VLLLTANLLLSVFTNGTFEADFVPVRIGNEKLFHIIERYRYRGYVSAIGRDSFIEGFNVITDNI